MKFGKRVADLEAQEFRAAPRKFHLLELDQGMVVGFSEADEDDQANSSLADDLQVRL